MQVRFRLAEILDEFRDSGRGTIKRISDETGLERHQVSALLKNEVQYLSLNSLGAICDYLINVHHMNPDDLPGLLFALKPEDFWGLLSERQSLVMSFGVRHEFYEAGVLWIPASDSYLQGMLLHELYGTPPAGAHSASASDSPEVGQRPAGETGPRFDQYMVRCFSPQPPVSDEIRDAEFQQMKREAEAAYEKFQEIAGSKALVCIGSVKSNGLCELANASLFSTSPWVCQEEIPHPGGRACPFFLRYREHDIQVPSCHGGRQLAADLSGQNLTPSVPGIFYEREPNHWEGIPSSPDREPALIVFSFRPPQGIVEVVLGGFSMVGTFLLAQHFRKIVREIWPPTFITPALEVGVFVVDFHLKPQTPARESVDLATDLGARIREVEQMEIIRLPNSVLEPRLPGTSES